MEKKTDQSTKDNNVQVTHHVQQVNLYDFGYEKSGNVKGDPQIFQSYLNRIGNGDLVDEVYKGLSDEDKNHRRTEMKDLEKELQEAQKLNEKTENEIQEKEKKIDNHRQELLNISEKHKEDFKTLKKETFSLFKFGIILFILVFLTLYLFFFYVSVAYKALYVDFEGIAESIAQGFGSGSIMPQPYELLEAIQYNVLLFLVPFVFYAFGWAFHILLELDKQIKLLYLGLLIAVTFTVDFLLAYVIHDNIETAKELMGLSTVKWNNDPTFYIILSFGFLVYIVWSILLDALMREWDKRGISVNIKKIIKHLQKDVKILTGKLIDTSKLELTIANYREDINTVMIGNLKKYIDQFTNGWISYLAPDNMKAIKTSCLQAKSEFEEKHKIKPGIVKVISKRG
jgi:hypothetical protein